jgi:hypothetical protein
VVSSSIVGRALKRAIADSLKHAAKPPQTGSGKEVIMLSGQIDKLCTDWLRENYGEEIASKYKSYSLVIPMWNTPDLGEGLETLRHVLCVAFGPDESFGTTDYHEARAKLRLLNDEVPIPEVFIKAFAET